MSIWGPISDEDIIVLDFDDIKANTYQGTSPTNAEIHLAVAPSWNAIVRLCVDHTDYCVTLGLDVHAIDCLIQQLTVAKNVIMNESSGITN